MSSQVVGWLGYWEPVRHLIVDVGPDWALAACGTEIPRPRLRYCIESDEGIRHDQINWEHPDACQKCHRVYEGAELMIVAPRSSGSLRRWS